MPFKNIIRVSEYERLYYDNEKPFKQKHWEALCYHHECIEKSNDDRKAYFRIINKGIQFTNYVGVLQAGDLTIEIIPKIDKEPLISNNKDIESKDEKTRQKWQYALLQMLGECRLMNVSSLNFANLNLQHHSILDIYLKLFLSEAEVLIHEGVVKNYHQKESNQTALKGRLLFSKQIAVNSVHAERFYVNHSAYNENNIYNYIIYKTLLLVYENSNNDYYITWAKRLLTHFPETTAVTINEETFSRLRYNRKTERYQTALSIARILLLNYHPGITGGTESVIAILFDMNLLWEEWVYRRLKKEETEYNIVVHYQPYRNFWKAEHNKSHKTIRPDIFIKKENENIVIDTKWKLIRNLNPDDDDLKQMFVYNLYWQSNKSVLLYPAQNWDFVEGSYNEFSASKDVHNNCLVLTATIFKDGLLDKDFAKNVLDRIFK
jgi:5-methylcytosine-specific restriction enzyme subunit McrC